MKDEALKLALEVLQINLKLLEKINPYKGQEDLLSDSLDLTHKAITASKQARAAPEPVRECNSIDCQYIDGLGKTDCDWCRPKKPTTPPAQRTWVGLTDEERESIVKEYQSRLATALIIEAKLKEKNT
jgi:hypothetical protein